MNLDTYKFLSILPLNAKTAPAAQKLINAGLAEYFEKFGESYNPDLINILAEYTNPQKQMLVGLLDGEVVATGALIEEADRVGRIVRMSVKSQLRGLGIAKRMVEALENLARARSYGSIKIETTKGWDKAIGLYLKCGYKIVGEDDDSVYFSKEIMKVE